ncbi:hypothetical protein GWK47_046675 [Chionoecetes opilio]|uniref:Uncharacterized protein n=1 Tax=Chionoecetes opilio TaxID=41210 RepID=A0A8J5CUS3_CHIOP|nr:hypothetical protein GWK47_046675 [Chionoecetes opilio]
MKKAKDKAAMRSKEGSAGGLRPEVKSLLDRSPSPSRCRVRSRLLPLPLRPLLQDCSTGDPAVPRGHHYESTQVTVIHTRTDPILFANAQNSPYEVETELGGHSRSFTESSITRPVVSRGARRHTSPLRPWPQ